MKNYLLIGLFCTFSLISLSQPMLNFEIGYNSQFGSPKGLNYIVDRYNNTRNYLDNEMKSFNNLNGLTLNFGFVYGAYIEFGFIGRSQKRMASGTVNGEYFTRYLKVKNNGMSISLGVPFISDEIKIIPGVRFDFCFPKIRTKIESQNPFDEEEWINLYSGTDYYIAPFIKIILGPIGFEPYFAIGDKKNGNIAIVNEKLNPNTYQNDPINIPFNHRGFGFKLTLSLFGEAEP